MSKISVIVPVYKVEQYLQRCVDSILAQTFIDFDLILIDDGSPDKCGQICDDYAEKDDRVYVIHQENGGLSAARNAGIEWALCYSDSEWVGFIDSDDWIHKKYLESLYQALIYNNAEISICAFSWTDGEAPYVDESALRSVIITPEELYVKNKTNFITAWGKLYRKSTFSTIHYPIGKIYEDEYVTYKILFKYKCVAFINQPLYAYYRNQNGITQSGWNMQRLTVTEPLEEQVKYLEAGCFYRAWKEEQKNLLKQMDMIIHDMRKHKMHHCDEYKSYVNHCRQYVKSFQRKKNYFFTIEIVGIVFPKLYFVPAIYRNISDYGIMFTIKKIIKHCRKGKIY